MTEQPLIWTSAGNLPLSELTHSVDWRVSPEQIIFTESYYLKDLLVKQSSHVKVLIGASAEGAATI
ncbi:MAG: hypothetical protein CGW95_12195 [Phenylobacterium zucineum]|nr:MAG: hypothetical protein CGW95_12195 [Phenylobacterium zucineum]